MTPLDPGSTARSARRRKPTRVRKYIAPVICVAILIGAAVAVVFAQPWATVSVHSSLRYLGVHEPDAPFSYYRVEQFAQDIGRQPNLVSYYSTWRETFQTDFAASAKAHGAETIVQIDPMHVSLAAIADGSYNTYLRGYAAAVKAFKAPIVMSFGHEMNGNWYTWGYQHTPSTTFVAAWRHIVTIFRSVGARNVTWLWTVNVMDEDSPISIPNPEPWWPGRSYVNWVGIDGYYYNSSSVFSSLFGPTIAAVRALTQDPILIAETGAAAAADQSAKINDLFNGVSAYGLLGFVWFDEDTEGRAWRITSSQAFAVFRRDAKSLLASRQP